MELKLSSLYDCRVIHARLWPKAHRLNYRLFWFALDLDEMEKGLPDWGLMGKGPWSLYRFQERDHLCIPGLAQLTLRSRLRAYLDSQGISWDGSRAILVTQLRFLGYVFNPVSFYYLWNSDGLPAAAVAEVGNTFGEMKLYPMGPEHLSGDLFCRRLPKYFYVSPFTDLRTEFEFRLSAPGDSLLVDVDDYKENRKILIATLKGKKVQLTAKNLILSSLRFPAVTLQIILLIHWNAFLLWLKKVPYFPKSDHTEDQREVLRPYQVEKGPTLWKKS